jgi:hypothetical protein
VGKRRPEFNKRAPQQRRGLALEPKPAPTYKPNTTDQAATADCKDINDTTDRIDKPQSGRDHSQQKFRLNHKGKFPISNNRGDIVPTEEPERDPKQPPQMIQVQDERKTMTARESTPTRLDETAMEDWWTISAYESNTLYNQALLYRPESFNLNQGAYHSVHTGTQSNSLPVYYLTRSEHSAARIQPWPFRLKPLLSYIEEAIRWQPHRPFDATEFSFESSIGAAEHNFCILENYEFDLQAAITGPAAQNTPLRPGSEFRPVELLQKVFCNHPLWNQARETLKFGFTMPLHSLPDIDRVQDVFDALRYGNHKSTQQNPTVVLEMLAEEVSRGWQIVLPAEKIPMIPGTIV